MDECDGHLPCLTNSQLVNKGGGRIRDGQEPDFQGLGTFGSDPAEIRHRSAHPQQDSKELDLMLLPTLCLLSVGLPFTLADAGDAPARSLEQAVYEQLDVRQFQVIELELPLDASAATGRVRLPIELGGRLQQLDLQSHSVRSPEFVFQVQDPAGRLLQAPAPAPATYRGTVVGQPDSRVALSLHPTGVKAIVREGDGRTWYVQPLIDVDASALVGQHLVYEHSSIELPPGFCGSDALAVPRSESAPPVGAGAEAGSGCLKIAELAFDCDYETFLANGSDVGATLADIDAVVNAANVYYARDVLIEHQLTTVIVRSSEPDPYTSFEPGGALDELVNEWRNNQGGVVRDMTHLATGKELNGNIIGLAYVGVVCNLPWAFGLTQWNLSFGGRVIVLAHELGHNWNAPHCLDPCGIMCGGCPYFGPNTTEVILAYRDAAGCLDDGPPHGSPLPPNVRGEALDIDGPVVIDVLANDLDGNCDTLTIDAFDAFGREGGAVTRSVGTGPGGRDELAYTPTEGFQGVDQFTYEVGDGTGHLVEGTVKLSSYDQKPDITVHFRFDELSGADMLDASGSELHGSYLDSPVLGEGGAAEGTGTSVDFANLFDRGRIDDGSPLSGLRGELSIAVWIRPSVTAGYLPIFGNAASWTLALRDGDLVFRVAGGAEHGLPTGIPLNQWSHVAAVYDDRQDVRFYLDGQPLGTVLGNSSLNSPGRAVVRGQQQPLGTLLSWASRRPPGVRPHALGRRSARPLRPSGDGDRALRADGSLLSEWIEFGRPGGADLDRRIDQLVPKRPRPLGLRLPERQGGLVLLRPRPNRGALRQRLPLRGRCRPSLSLPAHRRIRDGLPSGRLRRSSRCRRAHRSRLELELPVLVPRSGAWGRCLQPEQCGCGRVLPMSRSRRAAQSSARKRCRPESISKGGGGATAPPLRSHCS